MSSLIGYPILNEEFLKHADNNEWTQGLHLYTCLYVNATTMVKERETMYLRERAAEDLREVGEESVE